MKKRRLVFLTTQIIFPPTDGGKQGIYYRLREISRTFDVYCLMYDSKSACKRVECGEWLPNIKCELVRPFHTDGKNGNLFKKLRFGLSWLISGKTRWHRLLYDPIFKENLTTKILQLHPAAVVFEGPFAAEYVNRKKLKAERIQTILVEHNVEYLYFLDSIRLPSWILEIESNRIRKYELSLIRDVSATIAVSPEDARRLSEETGMRVSYMPSVLPRRVESWKVENKDKENPYFIFTGGLSFAPNFQGVVWMLESVCLKFWQRHPNVRLKITGKSSKKLVKAFADYSNVEFTGFLSEQDLKSEILHSSFAVVPIHKGSGVKIKLLDLLSFGVPVITTKNAQAGCSTVPSGQQVFLASDSPSDWLLWMEQMIVNSDFAGELGESAKKYYEREYSSDDSIIAWEKHIMGELV